MRFSELKSAVLIIVALVLGIMAIPQTADAKLSVVVSIPPQKYFVQKVGGDLVSIMVMLPAGADAHTYEPRPRQMAALSKAQIYFTVGVEFEDAWMKKFMAANPGLKVVRTEEKVHRVPMAEAHEEHHGQGQAEKHHDAHKAEHRAEEHHHEGLDPHIWLAPKLVAIQARAIRDGLVQADPANRATYERNLAAFEKEISRLDQELSAVFKGLKGARHILVYHPAWGYFCRAYGLEQVAIEAEGKKPTAKGLAHLIQQAKEEKAKVIFVQPQFSTRAANTVAKAIGGQVVAIDPLAFDWAANLRKVATKLQEALF
jgi:zinc transport system substrate-binding protein